MPISAKHVLWFLLSVFLSACSKTKENTETKPSGCTLTSLRELFQGTTTRAFFYTYDSQGRVSRIDFDQKTSATYETYTYSADKIIVGGTALGGGTSEYVLDGKGRVIRNGSMTFQYNSEGYLAQAAEVNGPHSTTLTFTYQAGNLSRVDQVGHYGGPQPVTTILLYEYDLSQIGGGAAAANPINSFGTSRSVLGAYFGKSSKNLVTKETAKTSNFADEVRTHTYLRDNKGNITTIKTIVSDGRVGEKQLAYSCQ
jgi:hypothetical protein